MDIDISCVHELWAAPKENWLDHFVNATRFKKLLNEEKKSDAQREDLRKLVIQFAEQATQVEAETETLIKKQFGQEDISFHERKSSCLWLCCLSSFAAIDWHFECLLEKPEDVILINSIFEKIELWKEHLSSSSSTSFSTFLISRWHCFVHSYFRIAPPEAKQTVSNPCNQLDVNLQRFEHAKAMVVKLRSRVEESQQKLDLLTSDKKPLHVPRPDCFIDSFIQDGGLSLSIGIVGENVLAADDSLRPRVPSGNPKDTVVLSTEEVVMKIHFELASSFFCYGKMINAVGSLKQLLKCPSSSSSSSSHPLVRIDERKVNGFALAFRIPPPYQNAVPSTSRIEITAAITSMDPNPRKAPQRKYGTRRDRRAEEEARIPGFTTLTSSRLDPLALCEDAATGGNTVGWRSKIEKTNEDRRDHTFEYLHALCTPPVSSSLPPSSRSIMRGIARYIIAVGMGSQLLLDCLSIPPSTISLSGGRRMTPPNPPPTPASIRAMAASDKPFWTLITSFDATELQNAFKLEGSKYTRPYLLSRCPEVFAELLLRTRPVDELHALLLGKLHQLTEMGDHVRWESSLNLFVSILGLNSTQGMVEMSIYEASRVKMYCLNRQLFSPHYSLIQEQVNVARSVAKALVNISRVPTLVAPMVSFLINQGEFTFVYQSLDLEAGNSNVILNAGRLLAAYGDNLQKNAGLNGRKAIAKTWHSIIAPYFEAVASKRRHDGFTTMHLRETSRVRVDLIKLFEAVKISHLQEFLISYFACIYTEALIARGRAHLRIYSTNSEIFSTMSLQLAHMGALEEVVCMLLDRSLSLEPHKATLLRTKADFAYVRNQLNEAGITYCELLVGLKPSLSMPLSSNDGVIDDSVWNHLRICLRKNNQLTLAACICQLFSTGKAKEFRKAAEAIQDRNCLDASDDCFGLIYDVQLAETLTEAYLKRGQRQKMESMLEILSSPTMNLNNGSDVVEREVRRKQKRMLNTLATLHFGIHP